MTTAIIIPARYGSTRFPGKPLHEIAGVAMLERVYRLAKQVNNVDGVYVATDDARIKTFVEGFGGQAVMTSESCPNGTARVWEAAQQLNPVPDIILNLQGDAPLTPPWVVQGLVDELQANADVPVATPATRMTEVAYEKLKAAKAAGEVSGTTVVTDKSGNAMYFSKSLIPFVRKKVGDVFPVMRHVGLYGYRKEALAQYFDLGETDLENIEGLEQLRYLYHGIPIRVVEVDYKGRTHWGVDSPEDAQRAEEIIAAEGELL
ncbi:MAG: 3-deoxy-manno-octulosonate cytidylyltransferase [Alphaproteobacteria bacterium]|nr:3-deoxy-manno-octulosonate cytidylyltransferase [Alphaproteobacteria bacterium]MDD9920108.1 3-deoxy-manno-octulosonate cytidylyltransferase [Alphaproteobacteria bacterium]